MSDLAHLMETVALRLLGTPNKELSTSRELRYGNRGSLSVNLEKGVYVDWEACEGGEGGGVLDLIRQHVSGDPIAWLRHEGLLNGDHVGFSKRDTTPFALSIWRNSVPACGTLVETYLRARAITIPPPPTLRFNAALKHKSGGTWPAMVALVTRDRAILGVHRTYLARDGSGKAPVEPQKMMLGQVRGGAVRLGPETESICIAEGIETALSVMQVTGRVAWAAGSAQHLAAMQLPAAVREVIVCVDGDAVSEHAAGKANARWILEQRYVRIARPPPGKDWNDLLREG